MLLRHKDGFNTSKIYGYSTAIKLDTTNSQQQQQQTEKRNVQMFLACTPYIFHFPHFRRFNIDSV